MHPNIAIVGRAPSPAFFREQLHKDFPTPFVLVNCLDLICVSESLVTVVLTFMAISVFNSKKGKIQLCGLIFLGDLFPQISRNRTL